MSFVTILRLHYKPQEGSRGEMYYYKYKINFAVKLKQLCSVFKTQKYFQFFVRVLMRVRRFVSNIDDITTSNILTK